MFKNVDYFNNPTLIDFEGIELEECSKLNILYADTSVQNLFNKNKFFNSNNIT
jgi:hypothetical protein